MYEQSLTLQQLQRLRLSENNSVILCHQSHHLQEQKHRNVQRYLHISVSQVLRASIEARFFARFLYFFPRTARDQNQILPNMPDITSLVAFKNYLLVYQLNTSVSICRVSIVVIVTCNFLKFYQWLVCCLIGFY